MRTIGIFSKLGMPGGSENRVTHLANSFCKVMPTYIFAQESFSSKLKPILDKRIILRENSVHTKQYIYEMQGVDALLVVNSDSYSFCKASFWDGTQGKHHTNNIDLSQIPQLAFLFNYVVSPAQWLYDSPSDKKEKDKWTGLYRVNPNIKILTTSKWFINLLETENKFRALREINFPMQSIESPVSIDFAKPKTESKTIRINRHSMAFSYKHDQENIWIVKKLCEKYGDKISFKWMGVPSHVRDIKSSNKKDKVAYKSILEENSQFKSLEAYQTPVPNLLSETDILFFYISRHRKEPWPRTIAEGMMAGCCCVTNNNYGMAEQIDNGKTGYLFNNAEEAYSQLCDLIDNPVKIKEMGNNAQNVAKQEFLNDKIIEKTMRFLG